MSEHTPGPWVAQGTVKGRPLVVAGAWPLGDDICEVCLVGGAKTVKANTRLIAAAPEMLEALEYLWAKNPNLDVSQPKVFELVRKAVEKARG